jgi:hypothetical protein
LLSQTACTTMRVLDAPGPYVETRKPEKVYITPRDGSAQAVIESPRVLQDTLFGFDAHGQQVTIPLSSLSSLRARELNVGKTATFTIGAVGVVGALAVLLIGSGKDPGGTEICDDSECGFHIPMFRIPVGH